MTKGPLRGAAVTGMSRRGGFSMGDNFVYTHLNWYINVADWRCYRGSAMRAGWIAWPALRPCTAVTMMRRHISLSSMDLPVRSQEGTPYEGV
ncbi:MAG: hypothetical protein HW394_1730 [Acidobacteria bacterium]|nr:hypothetical protein [Acidobacteriota bacterium]